MARIDRYLDIGYEERMLGAPIPEPAKVVRWLVTRGQLLTPGTRIAVIRGDGKEFAIHARFPCEVDGLVADEGERLYRGMVLLRVSTDHESEPEARHYCNIGPAD